MKSIAIHNLADMLVEVKRGTWAPTRPILKGEVRLEPDFLIQAGVAYNPGVWLDLNLTAGQYQACFFGFMILDSRFKDLGYDGVDYSPGWGESNDEALRQYFDLSQELLDLLRLSGNWEPELDDLTERVGMLSAYLRAYNTAEQAIAMFNSLYQDPVTVTYRVAWEVDVEATSAEEAAFTVAGSYFRKGMEHGRPGTACVFQVSAPGVAKEVDLAKLGDWSKSAKQLQDKYGDKGCPHAPLTRWHSEVIHECETRGYWDWVVHILATNQE